VLQGIPISTLTGDHNYIKGNGKFFSVAVQGGGGPVFVVPYSNVGKIANTYPAINGHSGAVYDTDWCVLWRAWPVLRSLCSSASHVAVPAWPVSCRNPFNDNMLATCECSAPAACCSLCTVAAAADSVVTLGVAVHYCCSVGRHDGEDLGGA
jgi:hypothetical protein